jgi:hypothetical protein
VQVKAVSLAKSGEKLIRLLPILILMGGLLCFIGIVFVECLSLCTFELSPLSGDKKCTASPQPLRQSNSSK